MFHNYIVTTLVSRLIFKMLFEVFDNQLFVGHFLA